MVQSFLLLDNNSIVKYKAIVKVIVDQAMSAFQTFQAICDIVSYILAFIAIFSIPVNRKKKL